MSVVRVLHTFQVPILPFKGGGWAILVILSILAAIGSTWTNCPSGESLDEARIQIDLRRNRRNSERADPMKGADIASNAVPAVLVPITPQTEVNKLSEPLTISTEIAPGSDNRNGIETGSSESG